MFLIDPHFLQSLSNNQFVSGYAEMLKHGLIKNMKNPVKILNVGKLNSKKNINIKNMSESAKKSIIDSGSTIQAE